MLANCFAIMKEAELIACGRPIQFVLTSMAWELDHNQMLGRILPRCTREVWILGRTTPCNAQDMLLRKHTRFEIVLSIR